MIVKINDFSFSIDLETIIDKYKGLEINNEDIKSVISTTANKYVFQINNTDCTHSKFGRRKTKQNMVSEINDILDNMIKEQFKIKHREERINSILK